MKRNTRLYVLFKAFTYDILFYYALEIMFLTFIKGFSLSQVFLVTSIDLVFTVVLTFPLSYLLKKVPVLGKLQIGCVSLIIYLLSFIFLQNFIALCFLVIFKSVGNILLSVNTTSLLGILCKDKDKNEASKIEGRATAVWWVLEAVSCIISGYLFSVNPFISYYITIGLISISLISTFFFKLEKASPLPQPQKLEEKKPSNLAAQKLIKRFSIIIICLSFAVWAGAETFGSLSKSMLQEFGASAVVISYVYFGVKILTAIANTISFRLEKKLGYKFMPINLSVFFFAGILMCVAFFLNVSFEVRIVLLVISISLQYVTRNPYKLNIRNTMINHYTGRDLEKILNKHFVAENLGGALLAFIASVCIEKLSLGYAAVINVAILILIILPTIIFYVKTLKVFERQAKLPAPPQEPDAASILKPLETPEVPNTNEEDKLD